jgi:hypothetical protein
MRDVVAVEPAASILGEGHPRALNLPGARGVPQLKDRLEDLGEAAR